MPLVVTATQWLSFYDLVFKSLAASSSEPHLQYIEILLMDQERFDRISYMDNRINRITVPEEYEVLDAEGLATFLGYKKETVQTYVTRGNWRKIPKPHRQLRFGPVWYLGYVKEWKEGR